METSLTNQNQNLSLEVKQEKIQIIGKEIYHINQIISFPMNDIQIEDMTKSIIELCPEIEPQMLKNIIDNFKTGKREWDRNRNIQNIFDYIPDEFFKLHAQYGLIGDTENQKKYYRLYEKYEYQTGKSLYKPDWMIREENK